MAGVDGCGKFPLPPGFDPQTVQPKPSRYTDRAIQTHFKLRVVIFVQTAIIVRPDFCVGLRSYSAKCRVGAESTDSGRTVGQFCSSSSLATPYPRPNKPLIGSTVVSEQIEAKI